MLINNSMSAASASLGAASPAAQGALSTTSASRLAARKRTAAPAKPPADDNLEAPPSGRGRKGRDLATTSANGDVGDEIGVQNHNLHGENQPQGKQKTMVLPAGKFTPIKQKTVKHTLHRESHVVGRRKPKSFWDVAGHFFSRFFVIFILGAGLGTSIWNWRTAPQFSRSTGLISTEVEKLEDFIAKTTKWMQVQLEVVDRKIDQEVGDLRKDLHDELDSQQLLVVTEVKNLKQNLEKVGTALDALFTQDGPLTKMEALQLIKDVVDKRAAEGEGHALSLDDIRTAAKQVVLREIGRHSADGIGRVDYALGSGGGKVIGHSDGYFLGRAADWQGLLSVLPGVNRIHSFAEKILQPSFGEPGQCLPLKGSNVWVDISLRTAILPDAVTLEHVSRDVAYDISSAPKEFRVFGWRESRGQPERLQHPVTQIPLGEFVYDTEKSSVQTFSLPEENVAGVLINMIRLHVLSNHGNPVHTCIYRFRVHGSDPALNLVPSIE